jgi:DNA-binding transcriptional LysR family regulator
VAVVAVPEADPQVALIAALGIGAPKKVQIGSDVLTILGLVAAGMGYSIVSDVSQHTCPKDVVLLDHPDLTMTHPVSFVCRADDGNPALIRFVDQLQRGRPS